MGCNCCNERMVTDVARVRDDGVNGQRWLRAGLIVAMIPHVQYEGTERCTIVRQESRYPSARIAKYKYQYPNL